MMARRNKKTKTRRRRAEVVYNGRADIYKNVAPSGKEYEFARGEPVRVDEDDVSFFLGFPGFEQPEDGPDDEVSDDDPAEEPASTGVVEEEPGFPPVEESFVPSLGQPETIE